MLIVQSVDNRISHQEKEQTRCFEYAGRRDEVTEGRRSNEAVGSWITTKFLDRKNKFSKRERRYIFISTMTDKKVVLL